MARLAISKDYFPAYAALPRKAQRKADEFLRKFEQDSTAASIHLEPLKSTLDGQLRSARIGDDYRMILRAPERGDIFLVLYADHHDEAYRWAANKQTQIHPATGSLQIFDVTAATEALTTTTVEAPAWQPVAAPAPPPESSPALSEPSGLFAAHDDDVIFLAGVPRALLPSVRALASDLDLDRLLPYLPPEAAEVLTALAAGISLDDALEEVLGRVTPPAAAPPPPPVDVTDVPAALERETTQRQFKVIEDEFDLDAALRHPLDVWRVFLHPRQRRLAHARTKGPTRVLGGAGTGKTVVALHRAAFVAREVFTKPDDKVLFTTFNVNLAQDLRAQLAKLLEPEALARVEVVNIDAWAASYLRSRGKGVRPAFEEDQSQHFASAYEVYGVDDVSVDFYRAEWRDVIQDQGLDSEEAYVRAVRVSRGVPLGRADRRRLWPAFAAYRRNLEDAGLLEPIDILRRARLELEAENAPPRYAALVVDETQDFSADGLRLLRAIAGPERPDDIFLVGDAHQRIYGRPVALSKCGIQVRGRRSQTLRVNYRTTGAICRFALKMLENVEVDDLDEGKADERGYVSLREGAVPSVHASKTAGDETQAVVATLKELIAANVAPEAICVVARGRGVLRDRILPALERANIDAVVLEQEEPRRPGVRLATMHRVKGLEFAVVLLVNLTSHDVPAPTPEIRSEDQLVRAQALLRERSLLYVAASRARDALHVFYAGEPSVLLAPLAKRAQVASVLVPRSERPPPRTRPPAQDASVADVKNDGPLLGTTRIDVLDLPTRMLNWAMRNEIETLGELVQRRPADLLGERNLGRRSIQLTRAIIERLYGSRWEDISDGGGSYEAVVGVAPVVARGWDALRVGLDEEARAIALAEIDLPARVESYARKLGISTLGELAERSAMTLTEAENVGRGSVADLHRRIATFLEGLDLERRSATPLLDGFKNGLEQLEPMPRIILTRRSGLGAEPTTLQELGDMFGVSRERIRQIEAKVCGEVAKGPWAWLARRRVEAALAGGALPLGELRDDPWWTDVVAQPDVTRFLVEAVFRLNLHVVDLDDRAWLTRHPASELEAARAELLARAAKIKLPAPVDAFETLSTVVTEKLGPRLSSALREDLRGRLQLEGDRVLALGDSNASRLLALLRKEPKPIHVDEVVRKIGRMKMPDEVIHFGKGFIGLREHFDDFDSWREALVPAMRKLIAEQGPTRQWHASELLEELREEREIPEWLTPFGLAALAKSDERLRYLGRLRIALPGGSENERRVHVHDAVEKILVDAGGPVPRHEVVTKLDEQIGVGRLTIEMAFHQPQFVRLEGDAIGLLSRDVPGGSRAIAEATSHLESVLARRDRGLSEVQAQAEIASLSAAHATWSVPLTVSVLRGDGRFRLSISGAVGLAAWESTRVPTRLEILRAAVEEAGGRVSIQAVMSRIEAYFGVPASRASVVNSAVKLNLAIDEDHIQRQPQD